MPHSQLWIRYGRVHKLLAQGLNTHTHRKLALGAKQTLLAQFTNYGVANCLLPRPVFPLSLATSPSSLLMASMTSLMSLTTSGANWRTMGTLGQ